MDLVTITDHNQIEGALAIAHLPGTFVSEELTIHLPAGRQLHLGVFDISAPQHERLQALRRDPEAVFAYLAEQQIPACLNHPFAALTGKRETADLELALGRLGLVETLNGAMPEDQNEIAHVAGRAAGLSPVGGSDAHALAFVGRSYTTVPGARDKDEFVAGLRRGFTVPCGGSGGYARLASEMARVFTAACIDGALSAAAGRGSAQRLLGSLLLAPLLPLVPLVALVIHGREKRFARDLYRRLLAVSGVRLARPSGLGSAPQPARSLG
jgi:hypothetical protein